MEVLYEDNQIIVVQKPQNVPSQEDSSGDLDMLSMVKAYIKEKYNKAGNVFIGLVHRLDRPTGGVMVFARNSKSAARLCEQLENGTMEKRYMAVLSGTLKEKSATLTHYLKKDEKNNIVIITPRTEEGAKKAILSYKMLAETDISAPIIKTPEETTTLTPEEIDAIRSIKNKISVSNAMNNTPIEINTLTLAEIQIQTGRSHQIRVQMSANGNALYGDTKYGGLNAGKANLALWACELKFLHPTTKAQMIFKSTPPQIAPWTLFNISKFI